MTTMIAMSVMKTTIFWRLAGDGASECGGFVNEPGELEDPEDAHKPEGSDDGEGL